MDASNGGPDHCARRGRPTNDKAMPLLLQSEDDAAARCTPPSPPKPTNPPSRCMTGTRIDRFGQVDVLVHNAGLGVVGAVADMSAEDVERIIDTNVTAFIDLARLVLPGMQRRGDGDVLVVSSVAAWVQLPPLTAYAASKRAVDGFVEGLRREVSHEIRVHSVNPGFVSTEFHARALGMQPREDDPGVRRLPGVRADAVSDRVLRELRRGRGRTVAVPRVVGLARLVGLPGFSHALDLVVRSVPAARLGRAFAERRAPGACHDDGDSAASTGFTGGG